MNALSKPDGAVIAEEYWHLTLYIAGKSTKSQLACANLTKVCEEYLPGRHLIETIDLADRPELARTDDILAIPTLVRRLPEPVRKVIGDLSNSERVLVELCIPRSA